LSIVYQCVSARLQYGLQYMRARGEICGLGEGMSEVGVVIVVVGRLYLDLERSLSSTPTLFVRASRYSHYSRDSQSMGRHLAEGMGI
jgi:hypothetical protein